MSSQTENACVYWLKMNTWAWNTCMFENADYRPEKKQEFKNVILHLKYPPHGQNPAKLLNFDWWHSYVTDNSHSRPNTQHVYKLQGIHAVLSVNPQMAKIAALSSMLILLVFYFSAPVVLSFQEIELGKGIQLTQKACALKRTEFFWGLNEV